MFYDDAFLDDILLPTSDSLEEFAFFDDALPYWEDVNPELHHLHVSQHQPAWHEHIAA